VTAGGLIITGKNERRKYAAERRRRTASDERKEENHSSSSELLQQAEDHEPAIAMTVVTTGTQYRRTSLKTERNLHNRPPISLLHR